jgi:hypothetical protein
VSAASAYQDSLTLREGRALYFARSGFDESSYDDRWVHLQAGPVRFVIPNSAARVRAVRFHDLHHVLTGYDTSWTGEGEIGAWEVASGCAHHLAAWYLNLTAMAIGLAIAPRAVFQAFVRGRRTRNLYRESFGDALLAEKVGDARMRLGLDEPRREAPRAREVLAFGLWAVMAFLSIFGLAILGIAIWIALS